ncbi:hypothetical protein WA026_015025 [Henosepilachna vigintioctopunctata]|uniref:C2H2-type domain-containing protein n=1 Tax=Henosepilachna vigintioctopunctata TaxID=420089 RepID=A0AAW1U836_9CUCU
MRLWTGLNGKGGAGGLLLDTGFGPSFLPLTGPVLEQVAAGNSEPGVTTLKLPDIVPKVPELSSCEVDIEVCFVCKRCRMAFPGESQLLIHQRQCYFTNQENRGAFRIVQTAYECKTCNNIEKFKNALEFRKHLDSETHQKNRNKLGIVLPPTTESPLSHEMEDVVNQITLLAARAAQEAVPEARGLDTSSGNFCQPGDAKRRFLAPPEVAAPPLTSAGH